MKKAPKKKTSALKKKAQDTFNAYIRERDKGLPCISCGRYTTLQAGHFYSAGHHNHLRFNEDNVHGQCLQCNYFLSGNLNKYRQNLIHRIGSDRLNRLDLLAKARTYCKDDSLLFDSIIKEYKIKLKQLNEKKM